MCNLSKGVLTQGRAEGRVEGRDQGMLEAFTTTITNMPKKGMPIQSIMDIVPWSCEQIEGVAENNHLPII